MTPQEFKAWFDGFTENVDKQPTQKQWARIKERVAEIDGKAVTERVYVDLYVPTYPYINYPNYRYPTLVGTPIYQPGTVWCGTNLTGAQSTVQGQNHVSALSTSANNAFDSLFAMNALGHADAASLNS